MMKFFFIPCILLAASFISYAQQFQKFSHRGGRGLMPENTVVAMQNALDFGTGLEMDLYLSSDQKIFVYHDGVVPEDFGSHINTGQSTKKRIIDPAYAWLRRLDVGSTYRPDFPRKKAIKAHIPLFAELIDSVESYARRGSLPDPAYMPELKVPSGRLPPLYKERLADAAIKIIKDKNITTRTIIQSFDTDILEYLHKKCPQLRTAYLVYIGKDDFIANLGKISFKPFAYSPHYTKVTAEMIAHCHQQGIKIVTWTVNSRSEIKNLALLGVDMIISDYPDYF